MNRMMKSVLAMLAVSACTGIGVSEEVEVCREYPVRLSAYAPETSTRISVEGTVVGWEPEDRIQITAVSAGGSAATSELTWFSGVEGMDSHFASFSGFVTMNEAPQDCFFIYPVKASTSVDASNGKVTLYLNGQTGLHEPFMYAYAPYDESGIHARMNHVGAMLEIDVQMDEVAQITFAGNQLEKLSPAIVDPKTGKVTFSSEANVQITVPVNPDGKTYISVPPVNLEKGFSIICSNADASRSMIRSFSSDGGLGSGYDFSRKVGQIIPIALDGELVSYSVTSTAPVVEHTKTSAGLLNGTSVKFTMNKYGVSDKMIEEWGATLVNSDGVTVRKSSYTNADPIRGEEVTMNVENDWKLLPAGQYTFTPYYIIFGQKVSMSEAATTVMIPDPGVKIEIHGKTSYDKYLAGDIAGANSHASTTIEEVAVTTNLDLGIIDYYYATMDGADMGEATVTSTTEVRASYGNLTRTEFRAYELNASIEVGPLIFTAAEKIFHITGLPYEGDFRTSNPTSWGPAWSLLGAAEYSDKRITVKGGLISDQNGAAVTPQFHIPQSEIGVETYADVCCKKSGVTLNVMPCTYGEGTISFGSVTVTPHKISLLGSLSSKDYIKASSHLVLSQQKPCMMFASTAPGGSYNVGLYRLKIEYVQ